MLQSYPLGTQVKGLGQFSFTATSILRIFWYGLQ